MPTNLLILCSIIIAAATTVISLLIWRSGRIAERCAQETRKAAVKVSGDVEKAFSTTATEIGSTTRALGQPVAEGTGALMNAVAERIKTVHEKGKQIESLRVENANLHHKISRLENQCHAIGGMEAVLKLALYEVRINRIEEFTQVEKDEKADFGRRGTKEEYVGFVRFSCKQTLGVDLLKLRFAVDEITKNIRVGCLHMTNMGATDIRIDPVFSARITKMKDGMLPDSTTCIPLKDTGGKYHLNSQQNNEILAASELTTFETGDCLASPMLLRLMEQMTGGHYAFILDEAVTGGVDVCNLMKQLGAARQIEFDAVNGKINDNKDRIEFIEKEIQTLMIDPRPA